VRLAVLKCPSLLWVMPVSWAIVSEN